ncbi:MAG: hypothetical protein HY769_00050 [Candidatus Stahlbacteria bacterium]|nr:hypothetical protein [Candidatus Stahlbacteria bacterium]
MKTYKNLFKIGGLLFLISSNSYGIYVPLESRLSQAIEELRVRGVEIVRYPGVKNYWLEKIPNKDEDGVKGWLISKIYAPILELTAASDSESMLRPTAFICYHSNPVNIVIQPVADFGNNTIWPNSKWGNFIAADYERAFIDLYSKKVLIRVGRERFAMGQSPRYNLLLSGYSPSMEGILASYEGEKFKFSFIFSRLENMVAETLNFATDTVHTDVANSSRFISVRRLDFSPWNWMNIGLSEVALYGGPSGIPSFYYLNPVALSLPYEFTCKTANHNVFWDIDWRLYLQDISFYGEFLIDDFQYGVDLQHEPNHTGLLVGVEKALSRSFILAEYTHITRWVYNHYVPWQRYEFLGYPIGHPLGGDFDNIFFKSTHHYNAKFDFRLTLSYTRHGNSRIDTDWPVPEWPRVPGTYFPELNFLVHPITTYLDIRTGVSFLSISHLRNIKIATTLDGEVGVCKVSTDNWLPVFKINIVLGAN